MEIYFVINNLFSNNLIYKDNFKIEDKMKFRTLSLEGIELVKKLSFPDVRRVFSSTDIYNIEAAKYFALNNDLDVLVTEELNDLKVGDLKNKSLKMLSYFQEKDFNFKNMSGESLNECGRRVETVINYMIKTNESSVVFLPRRTLFAYLIKHTSQGFNLDERLVLLYNEQVVMENTEEEIEIIKLTINDKIEDIKRENIWK